jgi:hypothetical protein
MLRKTRSHQGVGKRLTHDRFHCGGSFLCTHQYCCRYIVGTGSGGVNQNESNIREESKV